MVSRIFNLFVGSLLLISFIFSCASAPPKKEFVSPDLQIKEAESSKQVKAMNERILVNMLSSKGDPYRDYKIGPDDLLEVSVFDVEKLNKTVRVSSQGNISLPLIGTLRVKDLTAAELEKEIRELLADKYLQDPQVSVFVKEYRSQRISVLGAVEKPGIFEVAGQKTVLDLLAMAGGLKEDAGQLLFLIRPNSNNSPLPIEETAQRTEKAESGSPKPQAFVVDLEDLLVKGDLTLNAPLLHGDLLNIPISGKIYVAGEVKAPGGFPIKGKIVTVGQAVTMAGGLTNKADGPETKIFRYTGKEKGKEILSVNLEAVRDGQEMDLALKENDIVMVPKSGSKAFFVEFWEFLKGRVGSVGLGTL
jgi:polysaccharide biosynthesis/export protein